MAWTEQMVEDLRKMWKEGLTTGEIGKRLNVSKNSIVGKVHRLGLSGRPSPIKKKSEDNTANAAKEAKAPAAEKAEKKTVEPVKPAAPAKALPQKAAEPAAKEFEPRLAHKEPAKKHNGFVSLTDLDCHTCRWPIGDPKDENFHFCGKKIKIGQTYCDEHASVAYVKPAKK